jgi:hypothetical protein
MKGILCGTKLITHRHVGANQPRHVWSRGSHQALACYILHHFSLV